MVFMFCSFADKHSQPIAVFASKGPTRGTVLAQLIMKAIVHLEDAGVYVDAIVCDGAATNRRMWKEFNISGNLQNTRYAFVHPFDDNRKVFVFSDAPHLIKCVRNRLLAQKALKLSGEQILWAHYDKLYVADTNDPGYLRVCPKLSFSHLNPTTTEKMRVKLATQLFSRSVTDGLEYYSKRGILGLENVKGTVKFTLMFNDLFDALNRSFPAEGIKAGSRDIEILHAFLRRLDTWEREVYSGKIQKNAFLTESTSEGLRVTVQSTLALTTYLLEECEFKYVLTSKFNQDVLERFFGTIRQVGGQNDHPSMPTFLQLYNMLTIYSLVKPPKFGNCKVQDDGNEQRVLSLSDLKSYFSSNQLKDTKLEELKKKLDGLVESEMKCEKVLDHDYTRPEQADCIIYYVTGYLCRKLLKSTSCEECRRGLVLSDSISDRPEAALVNLKTRGRLLHPATHIFQMLERAEAVFRKHAEKPDAYNLTIDEMLGKHRIGFPCAEHNVDIAAHLFNYYVAMSVRQFCKQRRFDSSKSRNLRKLAKLV